MVSVLVLLFKYCVGISIGVSTDIMLILLY